MAGRLLFRLLSAFLASTGMTTFGEILSLIHGTSCHSLSLSIS